MTPFGGDGGLAPASHGADQPADCYPGKAAPSLEDLASHQEADSSAHLDKRNKRQHVNSNSRLDSHSLKMLRCSRKQPSHVSSLPSKEARLYAGADWLSLSVSQRAARGQSA